MSWNVISGYLKKYKDLKPPNKSKIEAIIEGIKKETNQTIEYKNITIQGCVARINGVGFSTRSSIYIKKEKILNHIKRKIGNDIIVEIK